MNWEFDLNLYDTYEEAYSIMKRDFDRDVAILLAHDTSFDVNNRKINGTEITKLNKNIL